MAGGSSPSRNAAAGPAGPAELPPAPASFSVAHSPLQRIVTIPARSDGDISPAPTSSASAEDVPAVAAPTAAAAEAEEEAARAFFLDAVASPRKTHQYYAAQGSFQIGPLGGTTGTSPLAGMAGSRPMQRFAAGGPLPGTVGVGGSFPPPSGYNYGAAPAAAGAMGGMAMLSSPYRYRSPTKSQAYAGGNAMVGMASPDVSISSPSGGFHFDIASLEKEAELLKQDNITHFCNGGEGVDTKKPVVWPGYGPAVASTSSSSGGHHLPPPPPPPSSSSQVHYRVHNGYVYHGGPPPRPPPPPGQGRALAQGGEEGRMGRPEKVLPSSKVRFFGISFDIFDNRIYI